MRAVSRQPLSFAKKNQGSDRKCRATRSRTAKISQNNYPQVRQDKMCLQEVGEGLRACISNLIPAQVEKLQTGEGRQCFHQITHMLVVPLAPSEPRCFVVSRASSNFWCAIWTRHSVLLLLVARTKLLTTTIPVDMCLAYVQVCPGSRQSKS